MKAGNSWLISILVFAGAGLCVYKAREYANAASKEKATTAHVVSVYHSLFRGLRFNYYSCSYNFSVGDSLYVGLRDCPQWIVDAVKKGQFRSNTGTDAIVYYDPVNPKVNSLLEFNEESQVEYRTALPWIGLGTLSILLFMLGRLLAINERVGEGGVVVDLSGTVIDRERNDFDSQLKSPHRETANSAPSSGLRELYLEVVNTIHPDRAANEQDLALRERLIKEANAAFERGDIVTLQSVLEEYRGTIRAS